jgi:hypothetical protein
MKKSVNDDHGSLSFRGAFRTVRMGDIFCTFAGGWRAAIGSRYDKSADRFKGF